MPSAVNMGGSGLPICERLRRKELGQTSFGGVRAGAVHSMLVNPDGLKAAEVIETLVEALDQILGSFGSDIAEYDSDMHRLAYAALDRAGGESA